MGKCITTVGDFNTYYTCDLNDATSSLKASLLVY